MSEGRVVQDLPAGERTAVEPFFFGTDRRLFGVHHPARPGASRRRRTGVVLCQPVAQEYIRSHRALLKLAMRLSDAGFPSLRFDFSGCGDSAGSFESSELGHWVEDAQTAMQELRDGSDVTSLCAIGLRIGASVALLAAAAGEADTFAVWDPVIDGADHLRELATQHSEWLRGSFARRARHAACEESAGFPLPECLRASLEGLDLMRLELAPATRVLVLETAREPGSLPFAARLRARGAAVDHCHRPAPPIWMKQQDELGNPVVPASTLDAVVTWIEESCP